LAIELIAARTNLFGVEVLSKGFGRDLLLFSKGQRTARARHQSLRATLDWSYRTLLPVEQALLRRLSVFTSSFTPESAAAVAVDARIDSSEALEALASLVSKSLVMTDVGDGSIHYRLLHVTRAYASEKLAESHEQSSTAHAHAMHVCAVLEAALAEWGRLTRDEWLGRYANMIDDVRAALDWAFGENGNAQLGAALTVASLPFGLQLSPIDEIKSRAQRALQTLQEMSPAQPVLEMRIANALGRLLHAIGAPGEVVAGALTRAVRLAEQHGDPRQLVEPYITRALSHVEAGDYASAVHSAEALKAAALEIDDGLANLLADRVGAQVYFNTGDFDRSRSLAERALRHPARQVPLIYGFLPVDRRVSMRATLARILWLEGFPDQAEALIAEGIELAVADGPATLCQALGLAGVPIAFWRGDLEAAWRRTEDLLEISQRHSLNRWYRLGLCYQKSLNDRLVLPGHEEKEVPADAAPASTLQRDILTTISPRWLDTHVSKRARQRLCGWTNAELLRVCGEAQLDVGSPSALAQGEACLNASMEIAQQQKALGWELRTVMSLAALRQHQGRDSDAYLVKARLKLKELGPIVLPNTESN
jgi:predicted ATPase